MRCWQELTLKRKKLMIPYLNLIKVSVVIAAIVGAIFWHHQVSTSVIEKAVTDAVLVRTQEINAEYTKRLLDLKDQQDKNQTILDNKVKDTLKEKQNALQTSTNKYNDLLKWVQSQPFRTNGSASTSDILGDTSNAEGTRIVPYNGLLRKDAIDLAEYAQQTEELKVYLVACYRQYDDVKETVDAFVLKHNSGKESKNDNLTNTKGIYAN